MAQTFTSTVPRAGGFLVSEANNNRSRDTVVLLAGQNLATGTVLGKITASGKYVAYNPGNSDGSQTPAGILWDATNAVADTKVAAITRDAEVNTGELAWFAGASGAQITTGLAGLAAIGIVPRPAI
jgi:hypothetical protein